MGRTSTVKMLNLPVCLGKDCPGDIMANDELKEAMEAEMAKVLEAEFRNYGMTAT